MNHIVEVALEVDHLVIFLIVVYLPLLFLLLVCLVMQGRNMKVSEIIK